MEIRHALQQALVQGSVAAPTPFDAVVILRGGGAVNDLAWLNDYGLARLVCDLSIPVLTGIGHERDNTMLDEVAHARYDTPSKVIAGIEQRIAQRVGEVKANFEQVSTLVARASQAASEQAGKLEMTVRLEALRHLAGSKQAASGHLAAIRIDAMQGVRTAAEQSRDALQAVKTAVAAQLADARRDVPALWSQIALGGAHALRTARAEGGALKDGILARARQDASQTRQVSRDALDAVSDSARRLVRSAATDSQALLREIAGQGPEKTLRRGFAIVRNQSGEPLTRVSQAMDGAAIEIEFQDGRVAATTQNHL